MQARGQVLESVVADAAVMQSVLDREALNDFDYAAVNRLLPVSDPRGVYNKLTIFIIFSSILVEP